VSHYIVFDIGIICVSLKAHFELRTVVFFSRSILSIFLSSAL